MIKFAKAGSITVLGAVISAILIKTFLFNSSELISTEIVSQKESCYYLAPKCSGDIMVMQTEGTIEFACVSSTMSARLTN